jgi:hypothetical protein
MGYSNGRYKPTADKAACLRVYCQAGALGVNSRRNGLVLMGKWIIDGGSVDVDFGDDTLYGYYT